MPAALRKRQSKRHDDRRLIVESSDSGASEDLISHEADAISSIAVVSALVFGFATSTFVGVATLTNEWEGDLVGIGTFSLCMAAVAALSGYATVYLSLQYYFLKRLSCFEDAHLFALFVNATIRERQVTFGLTWTSLALYFAALGLLAYVTLPTGFAVGCIGLFALGACLVLVTWARMFNKSSPRNLRRMKRDLQKQLRDRELQVMGENQLAAGVAGPVLPPGVAGGKSMIDNVWETRFRNNAFGDAFEWVANWETIAPLVRPHLQQGAHVLQVGCGNSRLAADLHEEGFTRVWSIDISPTVIAKMKAEHAGRTGLTYETMDATNLDFKENFFDTIVDKATLEAVPQRKHAEYLNELGRVLRSGGKYLVMTAMKEVPPCASLTHVATNELTREDKSSGEAAWFHVFAKK